MNAERFYIEIATPICFTFHPVIDCNGKKLCV